MAKKETKKRDFKKKWLHKYRLVVLNEDTYEEKFSLKLSRLNVFVLTTLGSVALIALTTVIIAFSPLREYIPGYSSTSLKRQAVFLEEQSDSLSRVLQYNNAYLERIRKVLNGDYVTEEIDRDSLLNSFSLDSIPIDIAPIREDSLLRDEVAVEDKYNLFQPYKDALGLVFYPPLSGLISDNFNPENNHYAIDIISEKDAPVKAIADGTVVFSDWTSDTGYVIIMEHQEGFLSAYKHNGSLFKSQGDRVYAGEVVATVGSTGEYTNGPHLHFELWANGEAVNPENYIDFK